MPVVVAERSEARVYLRSLAGIAGSNPPSMLTKTLVFNYS
jgi:hypothetical protein